MIVRTRQTKITAHPRAFMVQCWRPSEQVKRFHLWGATFRPGRRMALFFLQRDRAAATPGVETKVSFLHPTTRLGSLIWPYALRNVEVLLSSSNTGEIAEFSGWRTAVHAAFIRPQLAWLHLE